MTINEFAKNHNVKINVERADANPNQPDWTVKCCNGV